MNRTRRYLLCALWLLAVTVGYAQQYSWNEPKKPIVEFDPATGNYLYYHFYDTQKLMPYKVLSAEEFQKEQFANSMRNSWQQRAANNQANNNGLLPSNLKFATGSDLFAKVFGTPDITIDLQGAVELTFGGKWNYADNPIIPERYRRAFNFDFQSKINFNVTGGIGDKLKLMFNYNTEATFDFESNFKIEHIGNEDDILQRIEAGNISLPLDGTLITGNQSLFGIKADLRFGKLDVTGIFSRQDAEVKTIEVTGSGQTQVFEITADSYDANRHFFLSQYFKENYDNYLSRLPLILSGINVKRVEVWITNRSARFNDSRNLVAFMDLAESDQIYNSSISPVHGGYPDNNSNNLYSVIDLNQLRSIDNVTSYLTGMGFRGGEDFEKLENARKLLESEYTVNPQLGYISLNTALNNDEVLAVAYEYEVMGKTYKVGELSTDGIVAPQTLSLKLLKGTILTPKLPTWKLMMKNVYALNTYNLDPQNFTLDVMYQNSEAGTALPYIAEGAIAQKPLIRVLNLDNLNSQLTQVLNADNQTVMGDVSPDGLFDFVEGVTVIASKGLIIFPVLEPFGRYLEKQINNETVAEKYVYKELYDSSLTKAQSVAEKNKFILMGSFQSTGGSEIWLNAMNIPQGSVVVTAGGVKLIEGVDYEVNYLSGSVRIINRAYLESGVPLKVTLENRALFNMQTKTLIGTRLKYRFNDNFYVGGTILNLSERPLTQKVAWGEEPISNTIWGMNLGYKTDVPLLTKLVDAIPGIQTKAMSSISVDAEFAHFIPGHSKAISSAGNAFIDDFEGTKTSLDLRNQASWALASVPQGQNLFPQGQLPTNTQEYGFKRAKLAWYYIYVDFQRNSSYTPAYIKANPRKYQHNFLVDQVYINDLFPNRELVVGTPTTLPVLNLAYYPNERGPYNYDAEALNSDGSLKNQNPDTKDGNWAGIMRSLPVTDFETANYDYIEFWLMDPFVYKPTAKGGKLYFNLGNISEDILKDGYKNFENGLADPSDTSRFLRTIWGRVPKDQQLTLTFDNNYDARIYQDVGLDGISDADERIFFSGYVNRIRSIITDPAALSRFENDPAGDNYVYYLDPKYAQAEATILDCYKDYNGTEGNSRPSEQTGGENTMNTPNPDMEDVNRDYTMNESESYFQYEVELTPQSLQVGSNYITDSRTVTKEASDDYPGPQEVTWYQFKIPLNEGTAIGAIQDLKSIRFIRMFVRGFNDTTVMRFATLELVRGEWRRYNQSLIDGQEGLAQPEMSNAVFDISAVNIEENASRTPVNYVLPPGTNRQIDPGQYQTRQLNEQAMELKVIDLADGDARAAYKNVNFDFRQYKRIIMDVHAEAISGKALRDDDISLFVRIGNDYRYNYYEYEIPLKLTPPGLYNDNDETSREIVWPKENQLNVELEKLTDAKLIRNQIIKEQGGSITGIYEEMDGTNKIRIMGNPNLGAVKTILIGIRNPGKKGRTGDDGLDKSTVVWVNEFRLSNFNESSGFAALARMSAKLADFGTITLAGNMQTPNFGSLESKMNERSLAHIYQYDLVTNFELGMFFPKRIGVRIPFFFGLSENFTNPEYYPFDQDIKYNEAMRGLTSYERDSIKRLIQDYTRRMAINFTNVRVGANSTKQAVFHPSNLSLSFSYNQLYARNPQTDHKLNENYHFNLSYAYNVQPHYIDLFKSAKWASSKWLQLIRDFNFNPYPNQFSFNTDINRVYIENQYRSIAAPDIVIPATAAKDFTWDANYAFVWDLARSLKLDFNATNRARIDEPEGVINKRDDPDGYRHWRDSTWSNFWHLGRNIQYFQQINLTYNNIPINRIPYLDWITASARYGGSYDWIAAPKLGGYDYTPGNTISNARDINGNLNFSFEGLYNKVTFLRQINDEFAGRARPKVEMKEVTYSSSKVAFTEKQRRVITHGLNTNDIKTEIIDANGKPIMAKVDILDKNKLAVTLDEAATGVTVKVTGKVPKKDNAMSMLGKTGVRFLMLIRNAGISYTRRDATVLPGYLPESNIMGWGQMNGVWGPTWPFFLGWQNDNYINSARNYGWLSTDTTMINPYTMANMENLGLRMTLEPFRDFKIDLTASRVIAKNRSSYNVAYTSTQRQETGSLQITTISIKSAFENPKAENDYFSKSFENFMNSRMVIAQRLAQQRAASSGRYTPTVDPNTGFPNGYGPLSQEVLIPAFLSAYTTSSSENVPLSNTPTFPLPNWQIMYTGLSRIPAFKDVITAATLLHNYSSTFSVNSYTLNQDYGTDESDGFSYVRNTLGDFIAQRDIMNVSVDERFSPLAQLDITWFNNLSTRVGWTKLRRVGLSLANNQITELRSNEYTIGGGYTFREVPVILNLSGNRSRNMTTSLKMRADISLQEDKNILRRLVITDDALPQISDGKRMLSIKFSAEYLVSNNITFRLFFDRMVNTPYVSSIGTATTNVGFTLTLSLSQ